MRKTLILSLLIIGFISCEKKPKPTDIISEGIPGEIMVVTEEKSLPGAETVFAKYFKLSNPVLLWAEKAESGKKEAAFNYYFVRHQAYDGTEKHASSIIVWNIAGNFSDDLEDLKPKTALQGNGFSLSVYENVWATPQHVLHIKTESDDEKTLQKIATEITRFFQTNEVLPGNLQPNS